jgi:hypothetical protein
LLCLRDVIAFISLTILYTSFVHQSRPTNTLWLVACKTVNLVNEFLVLPLEKNQMLFFEL